MLLYAFLFLHAYVQAYDLNIDLRLRTDERLGSTYESQTTSHTWSGFSQITPSVAIHYLAPRARIDVAYNPQLTLRYQQGTQQNNQQLLHQATLNVDIGRMNAFRFVTNHVMSLGSMSTQLFLQQNRDLGGVPNSQPTSSIVRYMNLNSDVGFVMPFNTAFEWYSSMRMRYADGLGTNEQNQNIIPQQTQLSWYHRFVYRLSNKNTLRTEIEPGDMRFQSKSHYQFISTQVSFDHAFARESLFVTRFGADVLEQKAKTLPQKTQVIPLFTTELSLQLFQRGLSQLKTSSSVGIIPYFDFFTGLVEPRLSAQHSWSYVLPSRVSLNAYVQFLNALHLNHEHILRTQTPGDDHILISQAAVAYPVVRWFDITGGVQWMGRWRDARNATASTFYSQLYGLVGLSFSSRVLD